MIHPQPSIHSRALALGLAVLTLTALLVASSRAYAGVARATHRRVLANGLAVVVCPDPSSVDVSIRVTYDAGSRDEPTGLEGLAHLTEHLMFTGSRNVQHGDHLRILEGAGGAHINAFTSFDVTDYVETLPPERLELALWLESDRMAYPLDRLDASTFERERSVVVREYDDHVTDAVYGSVDLLVRAELFHASHPYAHAPIGLRASLERMTAADARAFAATWYGPANATLAIAGKVDPAAAFALAERWFGSIPPRAPPARPALPLVGRRTSLYLAVGSDTKEGYVQSSWVTAALGAPGDDELDIAAVVLRERIQQRLGGQTGAVTVLSVRQQSMIHASIFRVAAHLAPKRNPVQVLAAVDEEIERLASGVNADEVERARRHWYSAKLFALESNEVWAGLLSFAARRGQVPAMFDGYLDSYAAVAPARVAEAVRRWLVRRPRVVAFASPLSGQFGSGNVLGVEERAP